jgi:uncharacterized protein (TIGR00369 family)
MNMERSLNITWDDPIAAFEAGKALPVLEWMRGMIEGRLPSPPIARLLGFRLVEAAPGLAVFEITPGEQHYNPIGVVHGGVAMTLLDSAMGLCVHTMLAPGAGYTTLESKVNMVRPVTAQTGTLRAVGKVVHMGGRVATSEGRFEDAAGKLYAHGTSTCMVFPPKG